MMGDKSGIEWTEATWNPITGCTKVSPGCKFCYAERIWPRVYGKNRPFTNIQVHDDRMSLPLRWRRPRRIFVNSMSDLFHPQIENAVISHIFDVMARCPQHIFQVLTKRPGHMREFMSDGGLVHRVDSNRGFLASDGHVYVWPLPNVWLGVSVEDQTAADERIPPLLETPAAVRWLSCEPLLKPVDLNRIDARWWEPDSAGMKLSCLYGGRSTDTPWHIDWVVVGGESGRTKAKCRPMQASWAVSIMEQCRDAGVPFFMKQGAQNNWPKFKDFNAFPPSLQVRQYPETP